jgi:hypothetical protein
LPFEADRTARIYWRGKYVEKSKVTAGKELDQDQESECAGGYQGC